MSQIKGIDIARVLIIFFVLFYFYSQVVPLLFKVKEGDFILSLSLLFAVLTTVLVGNKVIRWIGK